ncbi:MAG: hypothetical protein DMF61_19510 [Blastocatellia bacterium AA13]|nr:MAG: hypothetical protein DMF61_19510 [Blastocatellia bacterium AA13]
MRFIKLYFALVLFGWVFLAPVRAQNDAAPKKWAVIVGVAKYARLPGGQQLQFAERDAVVFANLLRQSGFNESNLKLLVGPQATIAGIKSAIGDWLPRSAGANDTVYLYFSGHGFFEREFSEGYFLAYDTDPQSLYGSALSISDLKLALGRRVKAKNIVFIADAIRKDFFDPDSRPASDSTAFFHSLEDLAFAKPSVTVLMASSPGQFSWEGQRWGGQGAFTKLLAEAISSADRDNDGIVSGDEIFDFVREKLAQETSNKQLPWRSGASLAKVGVFSTGQLARSTTQKPVEQASIGSNDKRPAPAADTRANPASATQSPNTSAVQAQSTARANPAAPSGRTNSGASQPTQIAKSNVERPRPSVVSPVDSGPVGAAFKASGSEVAANTPAAPKPAIRPPDQPAVSTEAIDSKNRPASAPLPVSGATGAPSPLDEFRRAGQMLARSRALRPEDGRIAPLEKMSAVHALIALQFYDEADKSLATLQGAARDAVVENAAGIIQQGLLNEYQAERAYKRAADLDTKWASPHYNLAILYKGSKKALALAEFQRAAELDPKNAVLFMALGDEYFELEQWSKAADSYRKALAIAPNDDSLHTKLGHSLYSQGLRDEATREYQRARDLKTKQ